MDLDAAVGDVVAVDASLDAIVGSLTGALTYDRVPVAQDTNFGSRLDYDATVSLPIRGCVVALVADDSGAVLASTVTNDQGVYRFDEVSDRAVRLRVLAQTEQKEITVRDNTDDDALWVMESEPFEPYEAPRFDLHAASGWVDGAYRTPRIGAVFAMLDTFLSLHREVVEAVDLSPPGLTVYWSPSNVSIDGDKRAGEIGTSHCMGTQIYLLGQADVDTDEYDVSVLGHEFGHYILATIGRGDGLGGGHEDSELLDGRHAFEEGICDVFGAHASAPRSRYADVIGNAQAEGWWTDYEDNLRSEFPTGWYAQAAVSAITYDVMDDQDEAWDTISLGMDGLWQVMVGPMVEQEALANIFTFIAALDGAVDSATLNQLAAKNGIEAVEDPFAKGLQDDAGFAPNLPLYHSLPDTLGALEVTLRVPDGPSRFNKAENNRYLKVMGNGEMLEVFTMSEQDVDLEVFDRGVSVGRSESPTGEESVFIQTEPGRTYVAVVTGWHTESGQVYTAKLGVR